MKKMIAGIAAIVFSLVCGISFAESEFIKIEQEFSKGKFIIDVPPGYDEIHEQEQDGTQAFGFSTAFREDGTRGMVQVSVLDLRLMYQSELSKYPEATELEKELDDVLKTIEIEFILREMLDGVKRRRLTWKESEVSYTTLNGVRFARVEWAGDAALGEWTVPMKGVMYAGKVGEFVFVLHTQDIETYYDEALPLCERSLKTFRLMD